MASNQGYWPGAYPASGGTGWLWFAATILAVTGVMRILDAIWAFKYDDDIPEGVQTIIFEDDLAAWGWVWLILGVLLIVAAVGVVGGSEWARWFGLVVAGLGSIVAFSQVYFQPWAALIGVMLSILVMYALAVYGGRQGADRAV
jgi:hypothetical protein